MKLKKKKILMYVFVAVAFVCLIILWFFQFKINFNKKTNKKNLFFKLEQIYNNTKESYQALKFKELLDSQKNGININKLKDRILQEYVKKNIQEQNQKGSGGKTK